MGTNYYWRRNICPECKRYDELHIGKSSMGWTFSFRGYKANEWDDDPTLTIVSYADWLARLESGGEIYNEYGDPDTLEEFKAMIERKSHRAQNHTLYCREHYPDDDTWLDPEGHSFSGREFS